MREPSLAPTPQGHDFDLSKQAETTGDAVIPVETKNEDIGADMTISAADYDPTQDMKSDREKRIKDMEAAHVDVRDVADGVGEPVQPAPAAKQQNDDDEWEEVEIEVDDEDDDVDMFAMFDDEGAEKKKKKITVRRLKNAGANGDRKQQEVVRKSGGGAGGGGAKNAAAVLQIVDNVDDTDGYYRITPGEILDDGRYQVTITLGKGMFSAVVKAKVLKAVDQERRQDVVGKEVAIKVIRSQESMYVGARVRESCGVVLIESGMWPVVKRQISSRSSTTRIQTTANISSVSSGRSSTAVICVSSPSRSGKQIEFDKKVSRS